MMLYHHHHHIAYYHRQNRDLELVSCDYVVKEGTKSILLRD